MSFWFCFRAYRARIIRKLLVAQNFFPWFRCFPVTVDCSGTVGSLHYQDSALMKYVWANGAHLKNNRTYKRHCISPAQLQGQNTLHKEHQIHCLTEMPSHETVCFRALQTISLKPVGLCWRAETEMLHPPAKPKAKHLIRSTNFAAIIIRSRMYSSFRSYPL